MLHLRFSLRHFLPCEILVLRRSHLRIRKKVCKDSVSYGSHKHFLTQAVTGVSENVSAEQHPEDILFSGAQDTLIGLISGRKKATEVAHLVWKNVIQKGDTVVDATCGNGHDTLALLKMVANESDGGSVYAIDIQNSALEATSSLLDRLVDQNKRKYVRLFNLCHSRMEEILPVGASVRLVAFNLGYLPGGNKAITTLPGTTLLALKAATRVVETGGLISVMVYVGHPGGREELETVQDFASSLTSETWVSFKFEMLNRPLCPVLILLYRKT